MSINKLALADFERVTVFINGDVLKVCARSLVDS